MINEEKDIMLSPTPDMELKCQDCKTSFYFSEREKQFYKENEWNYPKRCKPCRIVKKQRYEAKGKNAAKR